ncbi:MAG: hypothetical protein QOE36_2094 [Gaiellaceae bacterium]|nr:hypothetical protein [Gaiellaceae bacterium]
MKNFLKGAFVGGIGATLVLMGSSALAGTGIGGVFNLGQSNTVNHASVLAGATGGDQLDVVNNSTASNATAGTFLGKSATAGAVRAYNTGGGPALTLGVAAGKPPFTTNSATRVTNLNADKLDGHDGGEFARSVPLSWYAVAYHCFSASLRKAGSSEPCYDGWQTIGGTAPSYSPDQFHLVRLRGTIACLSYIFNKCDHSNGDDTMFTLPPGFRPAATETFATVAGGSLGEVEVRPNGDVVEIYGSVSSVVLSGIAFSAA